MDLSIKELDQTGSPTALYVESSANGKHRVDVIVRLSRVQGLSALIWSSG